MSSVDRYNVEAVNDGGDLFTESHKSGAGAWVRYSDHAAALAAERERCIAAVDAEPELPGDMTSEAFAAMTEDRETLLLSLRLLVRMTKECIRNRIVADQPTQAATTALDAAKEQP